MTTRHGLLIIVSSPSGAGKSTLCQRLRDWDASIVSSISATTRPPRAGEVNGSHYHFLSSADFHRQIDAGGMLEYAKVFKHFYGTPRAPVEEAIKAGKDILFDIDWQGCRQIQGSTLGAHAVSIFLLPPSMQELRHRLEQRAKDSQEDIDHRMRKSWGEISHWEDYDYVLVNQDIDQTEQDLIAIVSAMRLKPHYRHPQLRAHLRHLQQEHSRA